MHDPPKTFSGCGKRREQPHPRKGYRKRTAETTLWATRSCCAVGQPQSVAEKTTRPETRPDVTVTRQQPGAGTFTYDG
jgi:hypothetical protein